MNSLIERYAHYCFASKIKSEFCFIFLLLCFLFGIVGLTIADPKGRLSIQKQEQIFCSVCMPIFIVPIILWIILATPIFLLECTWEKLTGHISPLPERSFQKALCFTLMFTVQLFWLAGCLFIVF